ncbi:hypothetical protein FIBSPDRAFT_883211 [Athelia psychrophila]|uniref:Uncharacterized protein n=1 Tax=Athelia psychrophila TaxID=1759441 RepID=A0A166U808_9AGAM|nr:hypothetical protein FIBSPDRAFT_883211 [Fibularhizoctonia sp. CBS 109695]
MGCHVGHGDAHHPSGSPYSRHGVDIGKPVNFDVVGLAMLTDIDTHIVEIQYSDKKSEFNSDAMLEKGTLRGLLTHDGPESGVAQNMLDLPLGHSTVQIPPRRTCYGLVHTFVMGVGITNTSHDLATCSMLRQLMAFWYCHLILGNNFGARTGFRVIMQTFTSRFFTIIEGKIVHTSYIWESILVGCRCSGQAYGIQAGGSGAGPHKRAKRGGHCTFLHLELDHLHHTSRPIQIDSRDWVSNQSEALRITPKKDIRIII